MPLVPETPNRPSTRSAPGLHAFIVGVSEYPDLPEVGQPPAAHHYEMNRLESGAISAYHIFEWLTNGNTKLVRPLSTCRMLLLPSAKEMATEPALAARTTPCTVDAFVKDAAEWRADASTSPDNVTLFYFAGHGVRRTRDDSVLLLEGFGKPDGGALLHAVAVDNIRYGMAPTTSRPNMAHTQLYFIDACRSRPKSYRKLVSPQPSEVFTVEDSADDCNSPVYFAAASDTKAAAIPGLHTLFSHALIRCLTNDAADLVNQNGQSKWVVTVRTLQPALEALISELNKKHKLTQVLGYGGIHGKATICELDAPPTVDVTINIEPAQAGPLARIVARDGAQRPLPNIPFPLAPLPYPCRWPAGYYTVGAEIDAAVLASNLQPPFTVPDLHTEKILPPSWERTIRMAP